MSALYDSIGVGYARLRQPDLSIDRAIVAALGNARSVVNVGAGTGSYEPRDRTVVAVEPAMTMIRQRPSGAAPVLQATAVALPFATNAFDAAMAVLTVHHWPDPGTGLREMRRVARDRVVILTWDPRVRGAGFWLSDYVPEIAEADPALPTIEEPQVRAAISAFQKLGDVSSALAALERDLESGAWRRRYPDILRRAELDLGYRLVVAHVL